MGSAPPAARHVARPAVLVAAVCLTVACVTAVLAFGELTPGSLIAVTATGTLVAGVGLARRTGAGAPPARRPGLAVLAVLGAAAAWEAAALARRGLPTVSDLADPMLDRPVLRAAATVAWLAVGAWLITRPARAGEAAARPGGGRGPAAPARSLTALLRTAPGRVAVLAAWLWLGVHFLAR